MRILQSAPEMRQLLGECGCAYCGDPESSSLSIAIDGDGTMFVWCVKHHQDGPERREGPTTHLRCPRCGEAPLSLLKYQSPAGPFGEVKCRTCEQGIALLTMPTGVDRTQSCCALCNPDAPSDRLAVAVGNDGVVHIWCDEHQGPPSEAAGAKQGRCAFCKASRFVVVKAVGRDGHEQLECWCSACKNLGMLYSQLGPATRMINADGGDA